MRFNIKAKKTNKTMYIVTYDDGGRYIVKMDKIAMNNLIVNLPPDAEIISIEEV